MKRGILKEKSFLFAVRMVNLYKHLCEEKMAIAQKEINETIYWLALMCKTEYLGHLSTVKQLNNSTVKQRSYGK